MSFIAPSYRVAQLAAEFHWVHAMFRGFARTNKNDWDVRAISPPQNRVLIDVHLAQRGAEFAEHRLDQCFCVLAEMTTRTRVQRNRARFASREPLIFRAAVHNLRSERSREASFRMERASFQ